MSQTTAAPAGLQDVVAAPSRICYIDGEQGILAYGGYNIHTLAEHSNFEEVIYLLWHGRLPKQAELDELRQTLATQRALPAGIVALLKSFPNDAKPMDVLRTAVSALGLYDPDKDDNSIEANWRKAARVTAQIGAIVAAFHRLRQGLEPLEPKTNLSLAGNFLWLLTGTEPSEVETKALDIALVLHADHEFNASTFAARVTIATLTDMYSAITSAIGTLAGPLHGGANEAVMKTLQEIGELEQVDDIASIIPKTHALRIYAACQKRLLSGKAIQNGSICRSASKNSLLPKWIARANKFARMWIFIRPRRTTCSVLQLIFLRRSLR
jgi:citrate synthase